MARQLWLLRHGEAETHGLRPDAERPLTERGAAQARAAGRALARLDIVPRLVFTSSKVRARETALLACEALGLEPVEHGPLAFGFDASEALVLLACGDENDGCVLVVGHEPDFSHVVCELTGARIDMKKGALAGVRVEGARGELIALLRPRELREIAR